MDKDTIKRLIIEYQQFVANITLIEREIHLSHQLNYVFVGLRRAGKSYLWIPVPCLGGPERRSGSG